MTTAGLCLRGCDYTVCPPEGWRCALCVPLSLRELVGFYGMEGKERVLLSRWRGLQDELCAEAWRLGGDAVYGS